MLLSKCLYIIELIVGSETNLELNAQRKEIKYQPVLEDFENTYCTLQFINLSTISFGIFGQASESFLDMCKELELKKLTSTT